MKLTIEPTAEIFADPDARVAWRVWTGADEHGTPVRALILAVQPQTDDPARLAPFDAALFDIPPAAQRAHASQPTLVFLPDDARGWHCPECGATGEALARECPIDHEAYGAAPEPPAEGAPA